MARIIQFDGRRIQVPDDATDDEIRSILDGGGAATPVAAPASVSPPAETFIQGEVPASEANRGGPQRALQLGIQDAGRSVANTVGFLPDLVNTIINLGLTGADMASGAVGGPDIPFRFPVGAGDTIAEGAGRVADAFGAERVPWEDRTGSEKLIGNIVDLGGQAGLAGGSLAARAPALAARIASGAGPRATDALVRPYLNGPGTTLAGDIASGAGAGIGQDIAEKQFNDNPLASFLLTLTGGVGGVAGMEATRMAGNASRRAFDNLLPEGAAGMDQRTGGTFRRSEVEDAARLMQEVARDPQTGADLAPSAAAAIGEAAGKYRDAGLPVPSTGLISDNLGLQAAETAARTRDALPFVQQDNKLRAAATDRVDSVRDPGADQGAVAKAAKAKPGEIAAARDADALPYLRSAEASGVTVDASPAAALIDQKLTEVKRAPVRKALEEARASLNVAGGDHLDTSVSGLYETRKAINDIIEGRGENSTGRFAAKELIEVRDALDEAINQVAPDFGEYLKRYRAGSEPLDALGESSAVTKILNDDPRDVAYSLLRGERFDTGAKLDEIRSAIAGNPEAERGWKSAVAEAMARMVSGTAKADAGKAGASDTFRVELGKIDQLFKRHRAALAKVFSPEEMHNLQQAQAVLEPLKNATMRATAGSNTADKFANMWRVAEAGLKARYGVLKGGGYLRTLRIMAETMPNNDAAVQNLIKRAYFDPDLAQYLLTRKVRNLDADASNAWVLQALAATTAGRTGDGE